VFPVFQTIRVPSRAGVFVALALAMLAAKAVAALGLRRALLAAIAVAAIAETGIAPIPTPAWADVVDTRRPAPPVYAWLSAQPGDPVVVELPIQDIRGVFERPAFHESIYLVHQTRHWKPLANGYAGIEPPTYVELRDKARRFPSEDCLHAFRERGVRYVIVHQDGYGPYKSERIQRELPAAAGALQEVASFGSDRVFELR
jgi:hypothetical protein